MIALLIALVIAVLMIWVIRTLIPLLHLPPEISTVLYVVLVVIVVVWLIYRFIPGVF